MKNFRITKPTLLALMFIFSFSLVLKAQTNSKIDVEKVSWQFSKMVIISHKMLSEARQNKDYGFVQVAYKYLNYAKANLEKLDGNIDPTLYEDAKRITNVLDQIVIAGIDTDPQVATASMIVGKQIDNFVSSIFCLE